MDQIAQIDNIVKQMSVIKQLLISFQFKIKIRQHVARIEKEDEKAHLELIHCFISF